MKKKKGIPVRLSSLLLWPSYRVFAPSHFEWRKPRHWWVTLFINPPSLAGWCSFWLPPEVHRGHVKAPLSIWEYNLRAFRSFLHILESSQDSSTSTLQLLLLDLFSIFRSTETFIYKILYDRLGSSLAVWLNDSRSALGNSSGKMDTKNHWNYSGMSRASPRDNYHRI